MIYQYIFGRDTEIGYKTINASTKLKTEGEYMWQSKLNIEYNPPTDITENYPEPIVYYNIKNQTAVIGKIVYQTLQQRNNYMQHYYLVEGQERDELLENNYQFDIVNFEDNIEDAYNSDIENQNIYTHDLFNIEVAKNTIEYLNLSKKTLELIVFACFEAVSSDKKVFFLNELSDSNVINTLNNNLELVKILFSILPYEFKERLGFITYYKHLVSPIGKALRSDIKLIFTENNEQNNLDKKKVVEDGSFIFDFVNNKSTVNTENILYSSLLELLTEPFFGVRPLEEVVNVLNKIISFFLDPYKINYNLAVIAYEILYRGKEIDFNTANILFDNFEILGDEIKGELRDWFLSEKMKSMGTEYFFYALLFKAYNFDEYKDQVVEFFAKQITYTKQAKYLDTIFDKQTPPRIMESVCKKLLTDEVLLEGGKFLIHNCIMNTWDKSSNAFHSIEVFDVIKYFSRFSEQYYKYFDELELNEQYFKDSVLNLDINGFESLSNSFNKLISNTENENTKSKFRILHRLILKRYFIASFKGLNEHSNLQTAIDVCFRLLNCVKSEKDYFQKDLKDCFREFSLNLVLPNNLSNFNNIDYYFKKSIENIKLLEGLFSILEEILIKSFSKKELSIKEFNNLFSYATDLNIKIDKTKIENFELLQFNHDLKLYMQDNNIHFLLKLIETKGSLLNLDSKNELINWLRKGFKGNKNNEFFRLLIYLYGGDYTNILSFVDKNDNYTSLQICMKEMKSLGLTNNKEYIKILSENISEDKKLKKHFKNLSNHEKVELGLDRVSVHEEETNILQKDNPFILYIIIYVLFSMVIFLATKNINQTFEIQKTFTTWFINIISILGIYSFYTYKTIKGGFEFTIVNKVLLGLVCVILFINVGVGILEATKPNNKLVDLYKQVYSIKYDKLPPTVNVKAAFVEDNGNLNILTNIKDVIELNENSNLVIDFNIEDENEATTNIKLNDIEKKVENNILKIDSKELTLEKNILTITAEDQNKNKSEIKLSILKQTQPIDLNALKFESSVYNEALQPTPYENITDGFKFEIPKNGKLEFIFNVETTKKFSINAKLNNVLIPLQAVVFLENGFRGKLVFDYDNLQDTNVLNIEFANNGIVEEHKFDIVKIP